MVRRCGGGNSTAGGLTGRRASSTDQHGPEGGEELSPRENDSGLSLRENGSEILPCRGGSTMLRRDRESMRILRIGSPTSDEDDEEAPNSSSSFSSPPSIRLKTWPAAVKDSERRCRSSSVTITTWARPAISGTTRASEALERIGTAVARKQRSDDKS